jgi:hypothetical protein
MKEPGLPLARPPTSMDHTGHHHFWHPALSRRQFIGAAGATMTGVVLGSGVAFPEVVAAAEDDSSVLPRPIPSGFTTPVGVFIHHHLPARGIEASQITDFKGSVGIAELAGTGTGSLNGTSKRLNFKMDNRFMKGEFVGIDGERRGGTFGFM